MTKPITAPAAASDSGIPTAFTAENLRATHPHIAQELQAEGAKAERDRILGIEALAMAGHEDVVSAAKADGKTTPEQLAVRIVSAEKGRGNGYLNALAVAEASNPHIEPSASNTPSPGPEEDKTLPADERCKAAWNRDSALRQEFTSFDAYVAYTKAQEDGRVRIFNSKEA